MRAVPCLRNPVKARLIQLILGVEVSVERIRAAYESLAPEDRDCLPYVPRLLAVEG